MKHVYRALIFCFVVLALCQAASMAQPGSTNPPPPAATGANAPDADDPNPTPIIVPLNNPPPADKVENPGTPPAANQHWIPGRWSWQPGNSWVWYPGGWRPVPHPYAHWVPGHWAWRPYGNVWIRGYWAW